MAAHEARAIVARGSSKEGKWKIEDIEVRPIGDDELLVQIVASGICHTDLFFGDTPPTDQFKIYPRVLGHEGAGYVKEVGKNVTIASPGDPVLLSLDWCGNCSLCRAGSLTYCLEVETLNFIGNKCFSSPKDKEPIGGSFFGQSSFASLSVVSQRSVVNVKGLVNDISELRLFAPLGCGIQTGSGTVINVANPSPDDSIAVLGLGGVGQSAIMAAKLRGVKTIIAIDRVPERIELAKRFGATHGLDTQTTPQPEDFISQVRSFTSDGNGPSISIETTGIASVAETAIQFTRPRGKIIQVGTGGNQRLSIPMQPFMGTGKIYMGAIEGDSTPTEYIPKMIEWYRQGMFPFDQLIKFFKAEDFEEALKEMHVGATAVKPVIIWE